MDIREIRRQNLLRLIEQRFDGNKSALARAIGKAPTNIFRWFNPDAKDYRGVEEHTARDIERRLGLKERDLDLSPDRQGALSQVEVLLRELESQGVPQAQVASVLSNLLDLAKSMNSGRK